MRTIESRRHNGSFQLSRRFAMLLLILSVAAAACESDAPSPAPVSPSPTSTPTFASRGSVAPDHTEIAPPSSRGDQPVTLATLWYSWFGFDMQTGRSVGGIGSSHWNTPDGARVGITDEPQWGFYASDDPAIIAKQLQTMQQTGINVIFASWFGWGDSDLDGDIDSPEGQAMDRAVTALFDYVSQNNAPFKLAIAVEPFHPDPANMTHAEKQQVLDYLYDNYYSVYPSLIYRWEAGDLLINFDPLDLRSVNDPRFNIRTWGSSNAPDWKDTTSFDWNGYPDVSTLAQQISDDGVIILFPRFDEYWAWIMGHDFAWTPRRADPYLEEGVYEQAWQVALDNKARLDLIILYSWNEHGDRSAIEPTKTGRGTRTAAGALLVEQTRRYYCDLIANSRIITPEARCNEN